MGIEGTIDSSDKQGYELALSESDIEKDEELGRKKIERNNKLSARTDKGARRRDKRIMLQLTKPSYTLKLGLRRILRHETRARLRFLLDKLIRQRNLGDASGVLSVLLKGTCRERSVLNNRSKYTVAIELLRQMKNDYAYSKVIKDIYNLWMKKTASLKARPMKDRSVLLESTISCLVERNLEEARMHAICLMQDHGAERDPTSNLILGLCYYEFWYDTLPREMQLMDLDEPNMSCESEGSGTQLPEPVNSDGHDSVSANETSSSLRSPSETSVMNNKAICAVDGLSKKDVKADINLCREKTGHRSQVLDLVANSADTSGLGNGFLNTNDSICGVSVFSAHRLDKHLFPIQLPSSHENMEDVINYLQPNDSYRDAIKYLKVALNSTPPASEALLPLVQLLLVGDQVKEALDVVEKFSHNSNSVIPARLKTCLLECLDGNNYGELAVCYEKTLQKDPTCRHSITRLIGLYQMGCYGPEQLLEVIGLHLDASFSDHSIWRVFVSCLTNVSQLEEDRISTCVNGNEDVVKPYWLNKKTLPMFANGVSVKNWRLRCKWWLNRHFSKKILASEMAAGELQLLTYKAACACQFYGAKFEYVVKVVTMLKEEKEDPSLLGFLQWHALNSSGFFCELSGEGRKIISSSSYCVKSEEVKKKRRKRKERTEDDLPKRPYKRRKQP